MKPIKQLAKQYKTTNQAALALRVSHSTLKRLIDADALYNEFTGEVWIMSKTKLDLEHLK